MDNLPKGLVSIRKQRRNTIVVIRGYESNGIIVPSTAMTMLFDIKDLEAFGNIYLQNLVYADKSLENLTVTLGGRTVTLNKTLAICLIDVMCDWVWDTMKCKEETL